MAKELERAGLPVVQICTMVNVALSVGSNRVLPGTSVLYPVGNPEKSLDEERQLRRRMLERAVDAVRKRIDEAVVLEVTG